MLEDEKENAFPPEFAFTDGQVQEWPKVLGYCEASALAASGLAVAPTPEEANKNVTGAGRAYFHTASTESGGTVCSIPPGKDQA